MLGLELRLLDPAVRADPAQVGALLHPDFVEFGASGRVWSRAEIVAALGADPGVTGEVRDERTLALAPGVVLVSYRLAGETGASLRSSVWVRDSGTWRLRFHQGTPAPG